MNEAILRGKLDELRERLREVERRRVSGWILMAGAVVIVLVAGLAPFFAKETSLIAPWVALGLFAASLIARWRIKRKTWSARQLARMIEARHPELDALLLTVAEQLDADSYNLFRERLMADAAASVATHNWTASVTQRRMRRVTAGLLSAMVICVTSAVWLLSHLPRRANQARTEVVKVAAQQPAAPAFTATVSPGDAEVERGARVIVEARFDDKVPENVAIVVTDLQGVEEDRIPMRLTVDQQVFGGLIFRVEKDCRYRVDFGAGKSNDYRLTTFVYPALERADVKITPPAYTGLPAKEIKNTLKVTALEGSELAFAFKVNKPVKDAELFGEDKTIVSLKPSAADPLTLTGVMKAAKSQKWRLHLVDEKERANKNPPWLTITVQANQLAKIEVVFPKRDIQVSSIQELPVEAKVWDDLGVTKSGAAFSLAGKNKEIVFDHGATAPAKRTDVKTELALETEDAEPRQLVSYYFWAEDKGPKGEVRRAMSDMFFAEVRHFEDIFREMESPPGKPGEKAQSDKLVDLQKQVVNATWRLIRDTNGGKSMEAAAPDVSVVHESQGIALEQTKEAMEKAEDAEVKTALTEAWKSMKDALAPLQQAAGEKKRSSLNQALTFEQSALEWLHRAQSREHQVMRQNQPSKGQSQRANENQLANLELKQKEQRYEAEKEASEEQTAEQKENLQVLNRLKELARRQEALAQKMKELQQQIEKAKTEAEKQELANQLKRLQEEQEQLLRDVDDLKERMEKPDNAANMADAKEQLDQTREKVLQAAEELKQQQLADAANSATRAQRELEKMQEDFKQKTAKRFSEEMKQLRNQARDVAERQKEVGELLEHQKAEEETKTGDTSSSLEKLLTGGETGRKLEEQRGKVGELLENMRRISEQADGNNPLLHRSLYEAVRKAQTGGLEENLEEAGDLARYGNRREAQDAERKASASVDDLKHDVDKAAESVLGSETDALRMARSELDKLIKDVEETGQGGKAGQEVNKGQKGAQKKDLAQTEAGQGKQPESGRAGEQQPGEQEAKTPGPADGKGESKQTPQTASVGYQVTNKESDAAQPNEKPPSAGGQTAQAGEQPDGNGEQRGQTPGQQPSQSGREQASAEQPGQPGQGQGGPQKGASAQTAGRSSSDQSDPSDKSDKSDKSDSSDARTASNSAATATPNSRGLRNPGADDRRRNLAGSGGGGDTSGALFFDDNAEAEDRGPLTGSGYDAWTDRLRNVEEVLSQPELRNEAAKVLDNARAMRIDHQRNNEPPQADHLRMRITQPLIELRDRVAEELARRGSDNPTTPVDRDPVPPAFRDLVRRYYTELGSGN